MRAARRTVAGNKNVPPSCAPHAVFHTATRLTDSPPPTPLPGARAIRATAASPHCTASCNTTQHRPHAVAAVAPSVTHSHSHPSRPSRGIPRPHPELCRLQTPWCALREKHLNSCTTRNRHHPDASARSPPPAGKSSQRQTNRRPRHRRRRRRSHGQHFLLSARTPTETRRTR